MTVYFDPGDFEIGPAAWPTVEELAQVLNVDNVGDWTTTLTRVLDAAIIKVQLDVGNWVAGDEPDASLAQAALRMAEVMALKPENAAAASGDPTYQRLLYGHRRSFGVA
jgi:hypothetical protein